MKNGNYGVLLSTFDKDGNLSTDFFRKEIQYCENLPIAGLMVCGSTGEFPYLDQKTYIKELELVIEYSKKKDLIAGISAASDNLVIRNLDVAYSLGYRQFICCPPYYYPQNDDSIVDFYHYISSKLPSDACLLLYNIPSCTSRITFNAFKRIYELENVKGMKDSSGDMIFFSQLLSLTNQTKKDFWLYTGVDTTYLPSLAAGGAGLISSAAWILADEEAEIFNNFIGRDLKKATKNQQALTYICMLLDSIPFPENYRALASCKNINCGHPQRHFSCLNDGSLNIWKNEGMKRITSFWENKD